jgi:ATP-dependent DNA helicase RecG
VKALLKYCEEPRKLTEMIEFMGKFASKTAFRRNILNPLIDGGKIKRTIPDKPGSKLQKYYSVKK